MSKILNETLEKVETVLTEADKTKIEESFKSAVDESVKEKLDEAVQVALDEKHKEYEATLDEYVQSVVESYKVDEAETIEAKAKEISEGYITEAKAEIEASYDAEVSTMVKNIQGYVSEAVAEVVKESLPTWKDEVTVAKANAIVESMTSISEKFIGDFKEITSEKADESVAKELDEKSKALDEATAKIVELTKKDMVVEAIVDMKPLQADKLTSLLENTDFVSEDVFAKKIENFKAIIGDVVEKKEDKKDPVVEKSTYVPSYKRSGKK